MSPNEKKTVNSREWVFLSGDNYDLQTNLNTIGGSVFDRLKTFILTPQCQIRQKASSCEDENYLRSSSESYISLIKIRYLTKIWNIFIYKQA